MSAHSDSPLQMMVSGHWGAEGGRSDIHPSKMEINALFDKRKQTIYVYPEELTASEHSYGSSAAFAFWWDVIK